mgnify:CR=1 FL=1
MATGFKLNRSQFTNVYTSWHFTVFRMLLGSCGCLYSIVIMKTIPPFSTLFFILFFSSHLLILIGYQRRLASITSCILWVFFLSQDLAHLNLGALVLISIYIFCITAPKGEPLSFNRTSSWTLPHFTPTLLWLSYGLFYSGIGISLLLDSRWTRGLTLLETLSNLTKYSPFLKSNLLLSMMDNYSEDC